MNNCHIGKPEIKSWRKIAWSYNCSLDDLDAWQIIADHREFLACADKRKRAEQIVVYQKEASAMEVNLVLDIRVVHVLTS